jgi:hypothetical protein
VESEESSLASVSGIAMFAPLIVVSVGRRVRVGCITEKEANRCA